MDYRGYFRKFFPFFWENLIKKSSFSGFMARKALWFIDYDWLLIVVLVLLVIYFIRLVLTQ